MWKVTVGYFPAQGCGLEFKVSTNCCPVEEEKLIYGHVCCAVKMSSFLCLACLGARLFMSHVIVDCFV